MVAQNEGDINVIYELVNEDGSLTTEVVSVQDLENGRFFNKNIMEKRSILSRKSLDKVNLEKHQILLQKVGNELTIAYKAVELAVEHDWVGDYSIAFETDTAPEMFARFINEAEEKIVNG